MPERLFALRGAISVDRNDAQDILDATSELMKAIMERNALVPEHVVCAREIPVPRALPRVIRVLIHYYADSDHESRHVYLGDASALRADLQAAQ
jgi:chorismate mutase